MINKKSGPNYKVGALGYSFVFAVMLGGVAFRTCTNDRYQDYVITDKGANKIVYHSIANPGANHIMTFDGDTIDPRGGFYPYLNKILPVKDYLKDNFHLDNLYKGKFYLHQSKLLHFSYQVHDKPA